MRAFGTSLLLIAALVSACGPRDRDVGYSQPPEPAVAAVSSPVTVSVESGGAQLPTYLAQNAIFVEGFEGQRYSVRLTNHTAARYEAVVTVDGRDVISGEPGKPSRQRGYIIEPYASVTIDGYRRSLGEVAAFRFSPYSSSYAARRGAPENVGVIGVALFSEDARRSKSRPLASAPSPTPFPAEPAVGSVTDDAVVRSEHLGTGYGERSFSPAYETDFRRRRRHRPDTVLTVFYDSFEGLQARGILPRPIEPYPVLEPYPVIEPYPLPVYPVVEPVVEVEPYPVVEPRVDPPWKRDREPRVEPAPWLRQGVSPG